MTRAERCIAIAVALGIVDLPSMHEKLAGVPIGEIRLTPENADVLARALLGAESGLLVREVCEALGRQVYDPGAIPSEGAPSCEAELARVTAVKGRLIEQMQKDGDAMTAVLWREAQAEERAKRAEARLAAVVEECDDIIHADEHGQREAAERTRLAALDGEGASDGD